MAANYDEAIVKVFLELEKLFTDNFKNLPTLNKKVELRQTKGKAQYLTNILKRKFVAIKFGDGYVVATPLKM